MAFTLSSSATTRGQALDGGALALPQATTASSDRLARLDLRGVARRAPQVDHLACHGHAERQILVDEGFVGHGPIHEMHRLRRIRRTFGHQILIELLRQERRERRQQLARASPGTRSA